MPASPAADHGIECPAASHAALTHALTVAKHSRAKAAVLRVRIRPVGVDPDGSQDWSALVSQLAGRIRLRAGDWGPLPDTEMGFLLVFGGLADRIEVLTRANEIVHGLDRPITLEHCNYPFTVAIGIAVYPEDGVEAFALLRRADQALRELTTCGQSAASFFLGNSTGEVAHWDRAS